MLLVSDSSDLHQHVADVAGARIAVVPGHPIPDGPSQLFQQLGPGTPLPQVIVLDAAGGAEEALALASRLHADCPGIAVVLVSGQPDTHALAALRAGARDIVHPDAEVAELADVLARALQAAQAAAQPVPGDPAISGDASARGRVISVVSPKGGVGKTTVATNLAVGLARTAPLATVLVDLDVQFGDVASALNMDPQHTLLDVTRGPAVQDSMVLKTFLTQHSTGLYAVCGPANPAEADAVTPADVARLLQTLASEFRYVVVDTAPGLDDHALAAIDQADELILLTTLDVPGVRGLRKEIDILRDLGLEFDRRHVLVNFADNHSGLSKADVEATIGTDVDLVLPRSRAVPVSVNQGIPLLQNDTRDPMTKQLRKLVDRFTPAPMRPTQTSAAVSLGGRHRLQRKRVKQ
nr:AAA family ATPase [Dietzia sp. E1]